MNTNEIATAGAQALLPCPFCGNATPSFERVGTSRQSCIVACGNCGGRHESSDEGARSGSSWNERVAVAAGQDQVGAVTLRISGNASNRRAEVLDWDDGVLALPNGEHRLYATPPAAVAAEPAKWIDDPHDIEQGMMLNPEWLKLHGLTAKEAIATPTPGDSVDAPVQQAGEAVKAARYDMLRDWGVRQISLYVTDGNNPVYEEELDRRLDAAIDRGALKGEQPVQLSGSERGEV